MHPCVGPILPHGGHSKSEGEAKGNVSAGQSKLRGPSLSVQNQASLGPPNNCLHQASLLPHPFPQGRHDRGSPEVACP